MDQGKVQAIPSLAPASVCQGAPNNSSDSPISTAYLSRTSASSLPPSLPCSVRNPSLCPGTPKLGPPSRSSRRPSALLPSSCTLIPSTADAFTTVVGAVLSQHHGEPPHLHPCAYYSRKLSPAERNYDIGNRELLAIKLALEEWRHWLEGAQHHFTVISDYKNLEYLRSAKRLNPRQARWALFFTQFQFFITYRPGDKNVKADSLSRIHAPKEPSSLEPILPPAILVSPVQ